MIRLRACIKLNCTVLVLGTTVMVDWHLIGRAVEFVVTKKPKLCYGKNFAVHLMP